MPLIPGRADGHVDAHVHYPCGAAGPSWSVDAPGDLRTWPSPLGTGPSLKYDSKVFETKFGQDSQNRYGGGPRGGEQWRVLIRGYLLGRVPMMKYALKWAEDFGNNEISLMAVESLRPLLDEDP